MLSKSQLINWKFNSNINPRTNRKIKKDGNIFKKISKQYDNTFNFDVNNIEDYIDIISQERFIILENKEKRWVYEDIDKLDFYKEDNIVRVFTKDSLGYMKKNNINNHPISNKTIPYDIMNIKQINIIDDNNIVNITRNFFQKLSKHSIFINDNSYLNLDENMINKLDYEITSIYYSNIPEETRKIVDKDDKLFKNKPENLENLKIFIIKNMDILLEKIPNDMKIFSYYIIVGALGLVIPEVKEDYPNYSFNF